MHINSSNSK